MKIIDLTHGIYEGFKDVYPGDELPEIEREEGNGYVMDNVSIGMHTGTHIDAPAHMLIKGKKLIQMPINTFCGEGCLIDLNNVGEIIKGSIVLINTGFSKFYGEKKYFLEYPVIPEELAKVFVKKEVRMVGVDTPSPDYYPFNIHKLFFKNNILIIENLTNLHLLQGVKNFYIYALPMKIDTDSAIARVIAVCV